MRDFEPAQVFFELMKGIIANLVFASHGQESPHLLAFHFPAPDAPEPRMSEGTIMINPGEIMEEKGVVRARAVAIGAQSIGALATGAIALGAFALGAVAIGCLVIGRAKIGRLEIGELVVGRLTVTEPPNTP